MIGTKSHFYVHDKELDVPKVLEALNSRIKNLTLTIGGKDKYFYPHYIIVGLVDIKSRLFKSI